MLNRLYVRLLLIVSLSAGLLASGCQQKTDSASGEASSEESAGEESSEESSSADDNPDDSPAPDKVQAQGSKIDASDLLTKAAPILPADTFVVVMLDVDGVLKSDLLSAVTGKMDDAARADLKKDLGAHFQRHLGLDLTRAAWAVSAMGEARWGTLILGGDISLDGLEDADIPGAKKLKTGRALVVPVEGGVALVPDPNSAQKLLDANTDSLAKSENLKPLQAALGNVPPGPAIAVARNTPMLTSMLQELPPPMRKLKTASVSLSGGVHVAVTAPEEAISAMQAVVKQFKGELMAEIDKAYQARDSNSFEEGLAGIIGTHMAPGMVDAYSPVFEKEKVTLSLEMGVSAGSTVAILGILSAIAVPAFMKYINKSKASEAEFNLKSIGDGATAYYHEEHASSDGMKVVTAVFPESPEPTCTEGSLDGSTVVPSATDWSASPWNDLRFSLSTPHRYKYCYQSSADRKSFAAWAETSLEGNGLVDSRYCIKGDASGGSPNVSMVRELTGRGQNCKP